MPTKCTGGALALPSLHVGERLAEVGGVLLRRLKGGRIERQGVQGSESGGPLKLREKEQRGGAEKGLATAPRKSLEELRSVSAPCLPVGGWGFFFPFIHTSPFSLLLLSNKPVGLSMCCEH